MPHEELYYPVYWVDGVCATTAVTTLLLFIFEQTVIQHFADLVTCAMKQEEKSVACQPAIIPASSSMFTCQCCLLCLTETKKREGGEKE